MPTPNGKATAIPASETDADNRMFEALKITPPTTIKRKRQYWHQMET